jgi:predicted Zn-dependent peptidase
MKIWNDTLNEGLFHEKLGNGINLYFYPKKGFTKKYAIFSANFGSNDLNFIEKSSGSKISLPSGTAHFLEHKLFEDPEKSTFESFAKYGANVNAYTNFDQTSYLFSCTDNFYESLELLVKFVQSPYLTEENIEKEKGIIGQEIQMYNDNPRWRVFFNCLKALYHNHPVKDDIAGTVESIGEIYRDDLMQAYEKFYHPSNMVLFVVGDLEFDKLVDSVNNSARDFSMSDIDYHKESVNEPLEIKEAYIEDWMSTAKPLFYIGFKDSNLGLAGRENVKKDIITNMILEMLFSESSEFYQELYGKGLIDSSFGAYFTGKKDYGHSFVMGQSDDPLMVKQLVMKLSAGNSGFLKFENFERVRKKEMGRLLMGLNSVEFIANNLTDLYFQDFYLMDYLDLLNEISFEDVVSRFENHFIVDNCVMSVIWPEDMVK